MYKLTYKTILFALFLILLSINIYATEKAEIKSIRGWYQKVNDDIAKGELYCITIEENKTDRQFPAIGTYKCVYSFYAQMLYKEGGVNVDTLLKVERTVFISANIFKSEFLYNSNGELVFHCLKHTSTDENDIHSEMRYYFHNDKLIRVIIDKEIYDKPPQEHQDISKSIIEDSKTLKDFYFRILKLPRE